MLVDQVASLFRKYTDESDTTFLTDADVAEYLYLGYSDFRQFIENIDYYAYKKTATYTGLASQRLDLANAGAIGPNIMGASPTVADEKVKVILRLYANSDGIAPDDINWFLTPVQNREALYSVPNDYLTKYCLEGTDLFFSNIPGNSTGFNIDYQPITPTTLFTQTNIVPGTNIYIDEFEAFHDLIALMAYDHYAIRDVADNPMVTRRMLMRKQQLNDFMTRGRLERANRFVISDDAYFVT
jgi:hypothetical protein